MQLLRRVKIWQKISYSRIEYIDSLFGPLFSFNRTSQDCHWLLCQPGGWEVSASLGLSRRGRGSTWPGKRDCCPWPLYPPRSLSVPRAVDWPPCSLMCGQRGQGTESFIFCFYPCMFSHCMKSCRISEIPTPQVRKPLFVKFLFLLVILSAP